MRHETRGAAAATVCSSRSSPPSSIGTMVFHDEEGVCSRVSRAETQSLPASAPIRAPRRWRRLTYALSPVFLSPSHLHSSSFPSSWSAPLLPSPLDLYQPRNRPQIYCLESARTEAPSAWLMTYRGCRLSSCHPRWQRAAFSFFVVSEIIARSLWPQMAFKTSAQCTVRGYFSLAKEALDGKIS